MNDNCIVPQKIIIAKFLKPVSQCDQVNNYKCFEATGLILNYIECLWAQVFILLFKQILIYDIVYFLFSV